MSAVAPDDGPVVEHGGQAASLLERVLRYALPVSVLTFALIAWEAVVQLNVEVRHRRRPLR